MEDYEATAKREGMEVHELWKTRLPLSVPKAIRYVIGFKSGDDIYNNWGRFSSLNELEQDIRVENRFRKVGLEEVALPVSLTYCMKGAEEFYSFHRLPLGGKDSKILVFYDDELSGVMEIEDHKGKYIGDSFGTLVTKLSNGATRRARWNSQQSTLLKYEELRIREELGEDISQFKSY